MADQGKSEERPQGGQPAPTRFRIRPWWIVFILALFALNYWAGSRATEGQKRIRVPYSPFFLQQVRSGNVAEITSKGTAIKGRFEQKQRYAESKPTVRFKTEIP